MIGIYKNAIKIFIILSSCITLFSCTQDAVEIQEETQALSTPSDVEMMETKTFVIENEVIERNNTQNGIIVEKKMSGDISVTALLAGGKKKVIEYAAIDLDENYDAAIKVDIGNVDKVADEYKDFVKSLDGDIQLMAGQRYELKGELNGGQIVVVGDEGDVIEIILNSVNINTEKEFAICSPYDCKVIIKLADGKENNINLVYPEEKSVKKMKKKIKKTAKEAGIFVKSQLTFSGKGTLNVTGNFKHAIECLGKITFISGTYNLNEMQDGISGGEEVSFRSGNYNIDVTGDGIKTLYENGFIFVENADMHVNSVSKGISAYNELIIADGNLDITSQKEALKGKTVDIYDGNIKILTRDDGINADDFMLDKNIYQENIYVRIAGGNIDINAWIDGIDSSGNLYFEGGNIYISGPTRHAEKIFDYNGIVTCDSTEMIAVGASTTIKDLGENPNQNYIIVYYKEKESRAKGWAYQVIDEADNLLMSFIPAKDYRVAIITSNKLKIGSKYKLVSWNHEMEVTLEGKKTIVQSK